MKPHPRIRKTIKWGGAGVTVLLMVVWIVSLWQGIGYVHREVGSADLCGGRVILNSESWPPGAGPSSGLHIHPWRSPMDWTLGWVQGDRFWIAIPIWMLTIPATVLATIAWRLDSLARRRALLNLCPKCHYDRAGLAKGAVCPECGAASPVLLSRPSQSPSPSSPNSV